VAWGELPWVVERFAGLRASKVLRVRAEDTTEGTGLRVRAEGTAEGTGLKVRQKARC